MKWQKKNGNNNKKISEINRKLERKEKESRRKKEHVFTNSTTLKESIKERKHWNERNVNSKGRKIARRSMNAFVSYCNSCP